MATCQICKYAGNPKDKPPCSDCKGYSKYEYEKPQTNADRIRAMSDEGLAKFIREPFCDKRTNEECKISYCGVCEVCVLDWLKQPAEV